MMIMMVWRRSETLTTITLTKRCRFSATISWNSFFRMDRWINFCPISRWIFGNSFRKRSRSYSAHPLRSPSIEMNGEIRTHCKYCLQFCRVRWISFTLVSRSCNSRIRRVRLWWSYMCDWWSWVLHNRCHVLLDVVNEAWWVVCCWLGCVDAEGEPRRLGVSTSTGLASPELGNNVFEMDQQNFSTAVGTWYSLIKSSLSLLQVVKRSIAFASLYSMFLLLCVRLSLCSIDCSDHQVDNIQHFLRDENRDDVISRMDSLTILLSQVTRLRRSETRSARLIVGFPMRASHLSRRTFFRAIR